jgi:hypothetical protein
MHHRHRGVDLVCATRKFAQHCSRILFISWLPKDFAVKINRCVGGNDDNWIVVPRCDCVRFGNRKSLHMSDRCFVSKWRLVNVWWIDCERHHSFTKFVIK